MYRYGFLDETQNKLDYVLALTPADVLERRLQTLVFKLGLAKSIHHSRVLIRQRHIRWEWAGAPLGWVGWGEVPTPQGGARPTVPRQCVGLVGCQAGCCQAGCCRVVAVGSVCW